MIHIERRDIYYQKYPHLTDKSFSVAEPEPSTVIHNFRWWFCTNLKRPNIKFWNFIYKTTDRSRSCRIGATRSAAKNARTGNTMEHNHWKMSTHTISVSTKTRSCWINTVCDGGRCRGEVKGGGGEGRVLDQWNDNIKSFLRLKKQTHRHIQRTEWN